MATSFKRITKIGVNPDKALEVLVDPEFQVARETAQDTCVGAKYREISKSGDKLVFEVTNTEYAKGVKGVDKKKTEEVTYTYTWDLAKRSCSWDYRSKHSNKGVKVWGSLRVEEKGSDSLLHDEFTVEVKIPLVGGKIEKTILKEVEAGWPKYEKVLNEWMAK